MKEMMLRAPWIVIALLTFSSASFADAPVGLHFDPNRDMHVSEVRPGMTGYGLSVFKGTKIEKFDVTVLSVLKHFNPKYDVVLVRCKGQNLEHTGSIAGMSGSPIFLKDDQGRYRLIGAFAYGWPLMKDPVGGVQPIEYMLKIPDHKPTTRPAEKAATEAGAMITAPERWVASDSMFLPGMKAPPPDFPLASLDSMRPNPRLGMDNPAVGQLQPLATPLMTSGLPTSLLGEFAPLFRAYGLVPLQAGGSADDGADPKLEPGSVLAVPLVTGDVDMTAVGTCTEVQGPYVLGFGHSFNNEGPIELPVGPGEINAVIANLMTSFKLGAITHPTGTLYADETVGVAGKIGDVPPMIPIHIEVKYTDGSGERSYNFQAAWHRKYTPLLSTAVVLAAITGVHDLPQYQTIDYDITIQFSNGQKLHVKNMDVNASPATMFMAIGNPMIAAADNPFAEVAVRSIKGTVRITPRADSADILWVNAQKLKYRPGETLKAYLNYRPFRGEESILPIEFGIPHDLPDGTYQFVISGWEQYFSDEQISKSFRFSAENTKEMFAVLRDISSIRHNALYMRLVRQPDGVAIGRTAMPNLPSSRREVIIGAGRSDTTAYVASTTKIMPMDMIMDGSAQLELTVEKEERIETSSGKVTKTAIPAIPKLEENKPGVKSKPDLPSGGNSPDNPPEP